MNRLCISLVGMLCCSAIPVAAQECTSLKDVSSAQIALYLSESPNRQREAACVAFAIQKVGESRYTPAIPVLVKFIDFRWPIGAHQKQSRVEMDHDKMTIYPAAAALEKFGPDARASVISAMGSSWISQPGLEAAVGVWITLNNDDPIQSLTALKQESANATDPFAKRQLISAAYVVIRNWCSPADYKKCSAIIDNKPSQ